MTLASRIDSWKYLSRQSDLVALLVHDHQTWMHNLITRVNYEHQYERPENSEEALLRYLLFVDEPALENPVLGLFTEGNQPRPGDRRSVKTDFFFQLAQDLFSRLNLVVLSQSTGVDSPSRN